MKTLSVMLLGMTMTAVISCTDNNDNEVTPVPNATMANLEGKWIIDMDGESDLDYYFLTLNFAKDKKAEIGLTIYDYDSDSYEQESIKDNPGCRGVVLLDYAGDNYIKRVNIYRLATGAVFSYAIGGWCETIISLFSKRPNQLTLFKASYKRLERRTSAYYTRSQEIVEELVAGNFRQ